MAIDPRLWSIGSRFDIPNLDNPEELYLTRWRLIQTPWFGVYLHRMLGPDSRPTLHDHPWSFLSIVLRGAYIERRLDPDTRRIHLRKVRWVNRMRTHDAHAIKRLLRVPTWTLVFVGKRRRAWGYLETIDLAKDAVLWTRFDRHRYDILFRDALRRRKEMGL